MLNLLTPKLCTSTSGKITKYQTEQLTARLAEDSESEPNSRISGCDLGFLQGMNTGRCTGRCQHVLSRDKRERKWQPRGCRSWNGHVPSSATCCICINIINIINDYQCISILIIHVHSFPYHSFISILDKPLYH